MGSRNGAIAVAAFGLLVLGFAAGLTLFVFRIANNDENPDVPHQKRYKAAEQVIDATRAYTATVETNRGTFTLELLADQSPKTVNVFVFLARERFWDGLRFHRVVANFVAQTGDPTGDGTGGPGFETEQEANAMKNTRGTVAMARAAGSTTFGSQWFINLSDNPNLDVDAPRQKPFYPFARVSGGMDVVDRLIQGDRIVRVTIEERPR
ncbi:MAG: peptidylprolyl isomerase [Dehalococcoidia bacterium]|nr:peptidylprolyl isomerase [Dehalococcoidia bacterium]